MEDLQKYRCTFSKNMLIKTKLSPFRWNERFYVFFCFVCVFNGFRNVELNVTLKVGLLYI